jgi:hypothetical protein
MELRKATHLLWNRELDDVWQELRRQLALKEEGRFQHVPGDPEVSDFEFITMVGEEFGEVCRAAMEQAGSVNDVHNVDLYKEIVQVAAICVSRLHGMNKRMESK